MDINEIKEQIKELIIDRESFICNNCDDIFKKDKEALEKILIYTENIERELISRTNKMAELEKQIVSLKNEYDSLSNKYDSLSNKYNKLSKNYDVISNRG